MKTLVLILCLAFAGHAQVYYDSGNATKLKGKPMTGTPTSGQTWCLHSGGTYYEPCAASGGGGTVASVSAGASGGVSATPTTGAVVVDIDTAVVPRKATSETISGLWYHSGGIRERYITGTPATNSITCDGSVPGLWLIQTDATAGRKGWICDGSAWDQIGGGSSLTTLDDVPDVTITSSAAGDYLYRNSGNTAWINGRPTRVDSRTTRLAVQRGSSSQMFSDGWTSPTTVNSGIDAFQGIGDGTTSLLIAPIFPDSATQEYHLYNIFTLPGGFSSVGVKLGWMQGGSLNANAVDWRMSYACGGAATAMLSTPTWVETSFSNTTPSLAQAIIYSTIPALASSGGNCIAGNTIMIRLSRYRNDANTASAFPLLATFDWTVTQ